MKDDNKVATIAPALSIREQAEQEVRKELAEKAKNKMKDLLRQRASAEAVVKGIDLQIADLEQQIVDGTI
jgi:F0F1-type ATP synthase membrane subunit b/b'